MEVLFCEGYIYTNQFVCIGLENCDKCAIEKQCDIIGQCAVEYVEGETYKDEMVKLHRQGIQVCEFAKRVSGKFASKHYN